MRAWAWVDRSRSRSRRLAAVCCGCVRDGWVVEIRRQARRYWLALRRGFEIRRRYPNVLAHFEFVEADRFKEGLFDGRRAGPMVGRGATCRRWRCVQVRARCTACAPPVLTKLEAWRGGCRRQRERAVACSPRAVYSACRTLRVVWCVRRRDGWLWLALAGDGLSWLARFILSTYAVSCGRRASTGLLWLTAQLTDKVFVADGESEGTIPILAQRCA